MGVKNRIEKFMQVHVEVEVVMKSKLPNFPFEPWSTSGAYELSSCAPDYV